MGSLASTHHHRLLTIQTYYEAEVMMWCVKDRSIRGASSESTISS